MAGPEITIRQTGGKYSIRAHGAVIGETSRALILQEGDLAPVLYIPRDDLQMVFLDASDHKTICPWKGEACYFHLAGKSRREHNVAWSYENPLPGLADIRDHLAFHDGVTVEEVS
ncbi:MAG: DUF427 domain-containing protein [Rhodobacteraceae bacterium]|nr:DUF427 domain-containing protein [Paracoccaceae bacterium]